MIRSLFFAFAVVLCACKEIDYHNIDNYKLHRVYQLDGEQSPVYEIYVLPGDTMAKCTKSYWEDRKIKALSFSYKGELNGPFEMYDLDGSLTYKGNYVNGKKHGKQLLYDESGKIKEEQTYNYDKLISRKQLP